MRSVATTMNSAPTLDWAKIWDEVDTWYQLACKKKPCKHCGHTEHDYPEWEDQQKAIQRTVNKHLRAAIDRSA